jgi:hypothetical protein
MTRLVAILVTLFMVAIPAKADVALSPPVQGWTVIQVYGVIKAGDLATFQRYTENVDPAATLVIVTGPGGNLSAGIGMGILVHQKKLIVGAKGMCASSCALLWMGGETGRKFIYRDQGTGLCFHQASNPVAGPPGHILPGPSSGPGNALIGKYLTYLGYKQDMIEWATIADPHHRLCLNPGLAQKKFNIDFWYNTEDGQHYTLPGNHGLLLPAPPHSFDDVRVGPSPLQANDRPSSAAHASELPRWNFRVWSYNAQNLERIYISTPKRTAKINENTTIHAAPRLTASGRTATTQNIRRTVSSTACTRQI